MSRELFQGNPVLLGPADLCCEPLRLFPLKSSWSLLSLVLTFHADQPGLLCPHLSYPEFCPLHRYPISENLFPYMYWKSPSTHTLNSDPQLEPSILREPLGAFVPPQHLALVLSTLPSHSGATCPLHCINNLSFHTCHMNLATELTQRTLHLKSRALGMLQSPQQEP